MGAQLWHYQAPWDPDAETSLKLLQSRVLVENYDLSKLLPQHLAWAREAVESAASEGDPYGLVEVYEHQVRLLEELGKEPIPENTEAQIEILRRISADSGQGIGNILDVTGVSDHRSFPTAERLSEGDRRCLVGSVRPTLAQASQAIYKIHEELNRGECVCFPVYDGETPIGWYFIGNTID